MRLYYFDDNYFFCPEYSYVAVTPQEVLNFLKHHSKAKNLLEVGSGIGLSTYQLKKSLSHVIINGIEVLKSNVDASKLSSFALPIMHGDVFKINPNNYDLIIWNTPFQEREPSGTELDYTSGVVGWKPSISLLNYLTNFKYKGEILLKDKVNKLDLLKRGGLEIFNGWFFWDKYEN